MTGGHFLIFMAYIATMFAINIGPGSDRLKYWTFVTIAVAEIGIEASDRIWGWAMN